MEEEKGKNIIGTIFLVVGVILMVVISGLIVQSFLDSPSLDCVATNNITSSNQTILTQSTSTLTPVGDGIASLNANANNQTWLEFDGVDDYIQFSAGNFGTDSKVTFSAFFKIFDNTTTQSVFNNRQDGNHRISLGPISNSRFTFSLGNGTSSQDVSSPSDKNFVQEDRWYHIVGVSNGSYIMLYIDGLRQNNFQTVFYNGNMNSTNELRIGLRPDGINDLNGSVDDVRIYNRTLTPADIIGLYQSNSLTSNNTLIPVFFSHIVSNESILTTKLDYLNDSGFNSITDVEYYNWTQGDFTLPDKPFIWIWDDGALSIWNATILMNSYGYKGVLAGTTTYINETGNLSWSNVTEMITTYNWSIASHSDTHCDFVGNAFNQKCHSQEEMDGNFSVSKQKIIDNTGITPITFIHPGNSWNSTSMSRCILNYTLCFGSGYNYWNAKYIKIDSGTSNNELVRIELDDSETINNMNEFLNYTLDDSKLQLKLNLNENSGTTTYDLSGNGNNGTITGATWNTDGLFALLTEGVDYSIGATTGLFTILNSDLQWSEMIVSWSYDNFGTDCPVFDAEQMKDLFGAFLIGIISFLGIIGILIGLIWLMSYMKPLFSKKDGFQSFAGN